MNIVHGYVRLRGVIAHVVIVSEAAGADVPQMPEDLAYSTIVRHLTVIALRDSIQTGLEHSR